MRCLFRLQPFLYPNVTFKLFPFPHSNPSQLTQYSNLHIKRIHLKPKKSLHKKKQKEPESNNVGGAIRSLFGEISDIIGEDSSFSGENSPGGFLTGNYKQGLESTPSVCENAQDEKKKDLSPMVHRVVQIVRGESDSESMKEHLEKSGVEFLDPEIVENVLKRCFKEPGSAMRFFEFVRTRNGFEITREIYNTMIYIAGEARDFDYVEKLLDDMERNFCEKDVKTWTILVSHYGEAKMIGKALASYDKMIKSGIEPDGTVYKSLIRSLCEVGEGDIAMEFYKEMVKLEEEENSGLGLKLYKKLINCVSRSGDSIAVRSIADDMIRVSEIPIEVVYGIVLKSFCVSGRIREALEFIRDVRNDDDVAIGYEHFETLVKGLCRADRIEDAVEIIEIMEKRKIANGEIYGIVVNAFLRRKEISKALELFETMKMSGHVPAGSTYTELMQNLFDLDRFEEGFELYEEMSKNGVECDIVATTAVVAGHVRARRVDEARRVFATLACPTWKAYSVLVRELCRISSSDAILEVLNEMRVSEIPIGDEMFRWVISYMERSGEVENLERVKMIQRSEKNRDEKDGDLLDKSETDPPQIKTYDEDDLKNLLEILLPMNRKWSEILEGLEKCEIGFTPELVSEALSRCKANGSVGLRFFSWVKRRSDFEHSAKSYNAAMKLAGQGKDFRHMRELLREMRRNRVHVSADTWTIIIIQYGRTGLTEIALNVFKEMKAERCEPTASTYKYLIISLCGRKGKKPEEATKLFNEMTKKSGFVPDKELVETYLNCLCETENFSAAKKCVNYLRNKAGYSVALSFSLYVRALCRAGKVDEALYLIHRSGAERENLELFTYGSVFHGLLRMNRLDEALEKLESMKSAGVNPTVHVYTSLIVHYLREKDLQKALETREKMREEGIEPTTVTQSAFIRGYVSLGRAEEAWKVFDRMKKDGPFPDFRTYSMFIDVLCQVGKSEEAMKLLDDMLSSGIVPSSINFKTVYHGLNREGKHKLAQDIMHYKFNMTRKRKFLL